MRVYERKNSPSAIFIFGECLRSEAADISTAGTLTSKSSAVPCVPECQ